MIYQAELQLNRFDGFFRSFENLNDYEYDRDHDEPSEYDYKLVCD